MTEINETMLLVAEILKLLAKLENEKSLEFIKKWLEIEIRTQSEGEVK